MLSIMKYKDKISHEQVGKKDGRSIAFYDPQETLVEN